MHHGKLDKRWSCRDRQLCCNLILCWSPVRLVLNNTRSTVVAYCYSQQPDTASLYTDWVNSSTIAPWVVMDRFKNVRVCRRSAHPSRAVERCCCHPQSGLSIGMVVDCPSLVVLHRLTSLSHQYACVCLSISTCPVAHCQQAVDARICYLIDTTSPSHPSLHPRIGVCRYFTGS